MFANQPAPAIVLWTMGVISSHEFGHNNPPVPGGKNTAHLSHNRSPSVTPWETSKANGEVPDLLDSLENAGVSINTLPNPSTALKQVSC